MYKFDAVKNQEGLFGLYYFLQSFKKPSWFESHRI